MVVSHPGNGTLTDEAANVETVENDLPDLLNLLDLILEQGPSSASAPAELGIQPTWRNMKRN